MSIQFIAFFIGIIILMYIFIKTDIVNWLSSNSQLQPYKKPIIIGGLTFGIIFVLERTEFLLAHPIRHWDDFVLSIFQTFIYYFLFGGLITTVYTYLKSKSGMGFKGFTTGVIIAFILFLIPSYGWRYKNYNTAKEEYNYYNFVNIQCGNNPSNECLTKLCNDKIDPDKIYPFCTIDTTYSKHTWSVISNSYNGKSINDWRDYVWSKNPNILTVLIPDIENGLRVFSFFNIVGLLALVIPPFFGLLFGLIFGKLKNR